MKTTKDEIIETLESDFRYNSDQAEKYAKETKKCMAVNEIKEAELYLMMMDSYNKKAALYLAAIEIVKKS